MTGLAGRMLGVTIGLSAAATMQAVAAQQRPESVDCAASHRLIRNSVWTPPPGVTQAQFSYCHLVPTPDSLVTTRLTVRPRAMTLGTRNPAAGDYPLDSLEGYLVYVPPACVGARRCPLVVFLHWGSVDALEVLRWQRPVADKYGMIVLAPKSTRLGFDTDQELVNRNRLDAALKQVLTTFAIDPDRIALFGHCNSGPSALIWGGDNLDIFSRVATLSSDGTVGGVDATNGTTEFLFDDGILQSGLFYQLTRDLRQAGHRVTHLISLRGHSSQTENFDFIGRWLRESWETPNPADRTRPVVIAPLPVLTSEALTKLTTFWTAFQKLPEPVRTAARYAHQREVALSIGEARPSTSMVDMPALAAQYPTVAAVLAAAGLTAEQHEALRVALIVAQVAQTFPKEVGTVEANSVEAKNVAFVQAHEDELNVLAATGIWTTP